MNKKEIIELLESLNIPREEYYILSGGCLLMYGLREKTNDLDLCVSEELFKTLKLIYKLRDEDKNEHGFYSLNNMVEIVVNPKSDFKFDVKDGYQLEKLSTLLKFKTKLNRPKDKIDILNIKKYLKENT